MRILAFALFVMLGACQRDAPAPEPANQAVAEAQAGPVKGVDRSRKGSPIPSVEILDAMSIDMESTTNLRDLSDGKPMLVNLWASWCAPCVKELPTLHRLLNQRMETLHVYAISQDTGPQRSVAAFLDKLNVDFIAYQDPKMELSGALGVEVMPTTVLYDAQGREVWRYIGDLDWSGAEAARLLAEGGVATGR